MNCLHVQLVPLFMAVQQETVAWEGRQIACATVSDVVQLGLTECCISVYLNNDTDGSA